MKSNINLYILLFAVAFGQLSCSSDKSDNSQSSPFDFNLRVFSHTEDKQQISSFGNSQLKLNDYVILYNDKDLFPTWSLEEVKTYKASGLQSVDVSATCYDMNNNKFQKSSNFKRSAFRLFETLPDKILLDENDMISCEYIVKGNSTSGANVTVVKKAEIRMDATAVFRIFPDLTTNKVYISRQEFKTQLESRNLINTDVLELVCKESQTITRKTLLSKDAQVLQTLSVADEDLASVSVCRLLSWHDEQVNISEVVIFAIEDIQIQNTFYSNFTITAEGSRNQHFYTFQVTNLGDKIYELYINDGLIYTQIHDFHKQTRLVMKVDETIGSSKPFIGRNIVQLLPHEMVEVYISIPKIIDYIVGADFSNFDQVKNSYRGDRITDVVITLNTYSFSAREASDSSTYVPIPAKVSDSLRSRIDKMRNSDLYRLMRVIEFNP